MFQNEKHTFELCILISHPRKGSFIKSIIWYHSLRNMTFESIIFRYHNMGKHMFWRNVFFMTKSTRKVFKILPPILQNFRIFRTLKFQQIFLGKSGLPEKVPNSQVFLHCRLKVKGEFVTKGSRVIQMSFRTNWAPKQNLFKVYPKSYMTFHHSCKMEQTLMSFWKSLLEGRSWKTLIVFKNCQQSFEHFLLDFSPVAFHHIKNSLFECF